MFGGFVNNDIMSGEGGSSDSLALYLRLPLY